MAMRGWAAMVTTTVFLTGSVGCTSVRMVQREGCWVRQTERWIIGTKEDMGPCQRPEQSWSDDPLTRLVQECVAQADYRWQARALAAWNRGEEIPSQEPDAWVLKSCTSEPLRSVMDENAALRARLESLQQDRAALAEQSATDREFMRTSHDRLTDALGLAAQKEPGAAVATATSTSEGKSSTQGELASSSVQESRSERSSSVAPPPSEARPKPPKKLELMRSTSDPQACPVPEPGPVARGPQIIPVVQPTPASDTPTPAVPVDTATPDGASEAGARKAPRSEAELVTKPAGPLPLPDEGPQPETATGGSGCPIPGP